MLGAEALVDAMRSLGEVASLEDFDLAYDKGVDEAALDVLAEAGRNLTVCLKSISFLAVAATDMGPSLLPLLAGAAAGVSSSPRGAATGGDIVSPPSPRSAECPGVTAGTWVGGHQQAGSTYLPASR